MSTQLLPAGAQEAATALGRADAAAARARRFLAGRADAQGADGTAAHQPVPFARISPSARTATGSTTNLSAAWTALGPATVQTGLYGAVTGRITAIALDPNDASGNTVWLGTTGGGVWKSANAAAGVADVRFAPLTDSLAVFSPNAGTSNVPSLSIGALAIQPAANPVVLAGTGDPNDATDSYYGEGLLRSADGGQTWTLINSSQDGAAGTHHFNGLASAGIAWNTTVPNTVVAAFSRSTEGTVVGATNDSLSVPGLYVSTDAGATWRMATVMDGSQYVQAPTGVGTTQMGSPATSVVWNPQRQLFFAAIQSHGYYSSSDGLNWSRLAHQPGAGLGTSNCPTGSQGQGSSSCPILRGTLAVQPSTGDMYALTVDSSNNDQGLWQDLCAAGSSGQCSNAAPAFATRLDNGALEAGQGASNASQQIPQGSYNLSLAAAPAASGGTLLFAGTIDLYRCSLAAGGTACTFRNTTNAGNGCNATSAVAPAQHALAAVAQSSGQPLLFLGNDGGLWRSLDGVAQTGSACSSTDASHFNNLNAAVGAGGSLAEVVGFAADPANAGTLVAGLGALGSASTSAASPASSWTQLSDGEGGFPQINQNSPGIWSLAIGAGVNVKTCTSGPSCTAAQFSGSADIGALQTGYDTAVLDAPTLLDPQLPSNLIVGTCRVWRGPAAGGTTWNSASALSPALDNAGTPCSASSALIRSLGAGGPLNTSGAFAAQGSEVLYAGMAGTYDGGGGEPGRVFVSRSANTAGASTAWTDLSGGAVTNSSAAFNAGRSDVSAVVVDTHDPTGGTVYATIMGFGNVPHVYRSTDFGTHWLNLTANLPGVPANALVVDPNDANTLYVATDWGVYATTAVSTCASQNCWSALGTGLPTSPVTQLGASPQLPTGDGRVGMLRAGTYGRGMWQTPLLSAHDLTDPELSATPGSLAFQSQPVGTQSSALSVTLLSYGNGPVTISTINASGDFAETDNCAGQTVAVGSSCTVSVRFTPTATGSRSGLLTLFANVPGGQITVALSGTATPPATVVLTPLQLTFPSTTVNQTSATQIVTVANTGGNAATLQTPTITGDFSVSANTCGNSLPPQTACSIAIRFTPTASGARTGVLAVVDNAGTQTAQLMGTGQSPATDTLTPGALVFAQQQTGTTSTPQQLTLANAGDVPLTLLTAVVTSGDFTVVNSCGTSLAAHSSCALSVSFVPTATGTRTGVLQVSDQFRTQTVALSGAGVAPPGVSLSPSLVSFGSVGVGLASGATTLTLTNNGGLPLLITSTLVSGDFSFAGNTCPAVLQPAAACSLNVSFVPTQPGPRTGSLTVKTNAGTGTQVVNLSGAGVDFALSPDGATSQTVSSGAIATYPLRLTSVTGLTGTVAFTCTGAPASVACTVNPAPAQLGGSSVISVTLQTGITSASVRSPGQRPSPTPLLCFLLLSPGLVSFRRTRRRLPSLLLLLLSAGCVAGLAGCGATRLIPLPGQGGGTGTGGGSTITGTGTYPITVTGSTTGVNHSVQLTLVVQ